MKRITRLTGLTLLLASAASGQAPQGGSPFAPNPAPAAVSGPQPGAPRDPLALPGDGLPPPMSAVLAPAMPGPATPQPQVAANAPMPARTPIPGPTLDLALEAAQAALAKCQADKLNVGVAVSDSLGLLIVGLQLPGAAPGRIYNAARKSLSAVEFGVPNSVTRDKLRAGDFATLARTRPNMTLMPGAVPLLKDGKVLGAVGVSGATSVQDEACAAAGAAAIAARL